MRIDIGHVHGLGDTTVSVPQVCDASGNCHAGVLCQDYFPTGNSCTFMQKLLPLYIEPNIVMLSIGLGVLVVGAMVFGGRR